MNNCNKTFSKVKLIAFIALFATLCCVGTCFIVIPMPLGYINFGDIMVLMSAWCLGFFGMVSASIGSALADIFTGYVVYAPATFVIKALMACVAYVSYSALIVKAKPKYNVPIRILSAVLAELVMVVGYFVYEMFLYSPLSAVASLVGACVQAGIAVVIAILVVVPLARIRHVAELFPPLQPCANAPASTTTK